jgi:hypothetical protein
MLKVKNTSVKQYYMLKVKNTSVKSMFYVTTCVCKLFIMVLLFYCPENVDDKFYFGLYGNYDFCNVKLRPTGIHNSEATIEYNLNFLTSFSP